MTGGPAGGIEPVADDVVLHREVRDRLLATVLERHPRKSFGYLLSAGDPRIVSDCAFFESNVRNDAAWKPVFEAHGAYFVAHDDAGFVAAPDESWRIQKQIWERGLQEVALFHSHQRHPANLSGIDYEMHVGRFGRLWHLIISMRNPAQPQLRAFAVSRDGVRELQIRVPGDHHRVPRDAPTGSPGAIAEARPLLGLDGSGRPLCRDAAAVLGAIDAVTRTGDADAIAELLWHGFLRDGASRYDEHVAPWMRRIAPARFEMGTDASRQEHYCGESPRHAVELSPHLIGACPVTNEMFATFDRAHGDVPAAERAAPVSAVTWSEAALFAMWMGCRLPTEAEWEHACGGGAASPWCCEDERSLDRHAWYSQNAGDRLHPVRGREPNAFGLFDLHGNVWEWCADVYDGRWYERAPVRDPVCDAPGAGSPQRAAHRVCRGGSVFSLAEMCRTRFRLHEPPDFRAADLGFRLARHAGRGTEETRPPCA